MNPSGPSEQPAAGQTMRDRAVAHAKDLLNAGACMYGYADVGRSNGASRFSEADVRLTSTTVAFYFCCDSACALRRLGGFGARVTMP